MSEYYGKKVDVVFAIDTSRSMSAADCPGGNTRLQWAKTKAAGMISMLRGERVGLLVFAGDTFVQCPLTEDYGAATMLLRDIDVKSVPAGGSDFGSAISAAAGLFGEDETERAVVIFSDGEDHSGRALDAAAQAAEGDISIYSIGMGSLAGADLFDESKNKYIKDEDGNVVHSRLEEQTLQSVAMRTGGTYVSTTADDMDLTEIYTNRIALYEADPTGEKGMKKTAVERFAWGIFPALLLLGAEVLTGVLQGRNIAG